MTTPNDPNAPQWDNPARPPAEGQPPTPAVPNYGQPPAGPFGQPAQPPYGQPPQPQPQPPYGQSAQPNDQQPQQPYGQSVQPYDQQPPQQYGQPPVSPYGQPQAPQQFGQPGAYPQPSAYPQIGYPAATMAGGVPGPVTTASVLLFVFAGLSALVGVVALFAASAAGNVDIPGVGALAGAAAFIGVLFLGFAALDIVLGLRIRGAKAWARITAIVWSSLWLVLWVVGMFNSHGTTTRTVNGRTTTTNSSSPVLSLVFIVATGLIIYLLSFDKRAKEFFAGRR